MYTKFNPLFENSTISHLFTSYMTKTVYSKS